MLKNVTERKVWMGVIGGLSLITMVMIVSPFIYYNDTFTATVTEISYHGQGGIIGSSKATVKFDDGRVYSFYKVPEGLREGYTYTLEYRTPYILRDSFIVIIESLD